MADVPSDSEATRDDVAAATHMHEYKHCMCNLQRMIPCQTGALPKVLHRPQALADGGAQLEELELALNEVTAAGAGALAAALARHEHLAVALAELAEFAEAKVGDSRLVRPPRSASGHNCTQPARAHSCTCAHFAPHQDHLSEGAPHARWRG